METLIFTAGVLLAMGISLGVGSSTLAVLNFFVAIKDGKIEETERHFMGITYIVLRVAMVIILFSSATLVLTIGQEYLNTYTMAQFLLIGMLYLNAILMTLRLMPSTFGPAIQASSWYTLGFLLAFYNQGVSDFSMTTFLLGYLAMFLVAVAIINGVMGYLKSQRKES
ncbi:MAG: hypothetical protein UZ19_OD1000081 [Parcubacteria bacterium OLB19]|nr:MAG: hypothetical protein UZ19_OD1000081 [Parcubacteria bacterium OLB19]